MNNPLFRPPAEAYSAILQIDRGCPHNKCTFCAMYRAVRYQRLTMEEISIMIREYASRLPHTKRIFLADGDVMRRSFEELKEILQLLNRSFPRLTRISLYAGGSSIAAKSEAELKQLKKLKLHTLYMGLESGSEKILQRCRKADTAAQMVDACIKAQSCGLRMSVMILLGLGGQELTAEHADMTADALNRMQPRLLSALRVVPIEGTELYRDLQSGRFQQLTEYGVIEELRRIISRLRLQSCVFRANHGSNVVPLEARLPRDKPRLLAELETLLQSGTLDCDSPGTMPLYL